jgi:hypothetical protein
MGFSKKLLGFYSGKRNYQVSTVGYGDILPENRHMIIGLTIYLPVAAILWSVALGSAIALANERV